MENPYLLMILTAGPGFFSFSSIPVNQEKMAPDINSMVGALFKNASV